MSDSSGLGKQILTLKKASDTRRLEQFIRQEEARGVGSASRKDFDRVLSATVKQPQSEDQTSH